MRRRQVLLLTTMVALTPALAFGSGGYSGVTADRTVDLAVVGDANAYLGVETLRTQGYVDGNPITVVRLTDRFPGDAVLESVSTSGAYLTVATATPADVDGASGPLPVRMSCRSPGSGTVTVTVSVSDGTATATVERSAGVTCVQPEIRRVEFRGCGNARIEADDAVYPLTATKVVVDPSTGESRTTTVTLTGDSKVRAGPDGKLVAIEAGGDRYENDNRCVRTEATGTPTA
ncbi:MAG: hypothetical protein ABEJ26_07575 [Halosimplex sp.]